MNEAVAFLVFNRPQCTERTFAEIRRARPPRLLVIADGPRPDHPDDVVKCRAVREIIDRGIDWHCELERNYAQDNMGCAPRVATGLTWAFAHAERLIIIEDDCLPDPSFFRYCEELLERFCDDTRVGQICGTPFIESRVNTEFSYIFSRYGPIWGWASWRRAWNCYDLELRSWPSLKRTGNLASIISSPREQRLRSKLYDRLCSGGRSTWDFQWGYAKLFNSMLSIIPAVSLIENIGYGDDATHTTGNHRRLERNSMQFPLRHPDLIIPDARFETAFSHCFAPPPLRRARSTFVNAISALWRKVRLNAGPTQ